MLDLEKPGRVHGNHEVVTLLEDWLARAKEGRFSYATVTVCEPPNLMACDFAGSVEMEYAVDAALQMLKLKIEQNIANRQPPAVDNHAPADRWIYNVANAPVSYDFIPWLIDAEMTRRREGAEAPLRVSFVKGKTGKMGLDGWYRSQMFAGVVRPALSLLGAEERSETGRIKEFYTTADIVKYSRAGESVPMLQSTPLAKKEVREQLDGEKPVVITLRESENWTHRNSNLKEWIRFATYLRSRGERVIFVRDTAKATEPLPGWETYPRASVELDIRLALYEQAKCNFFVPNGPWGLAIFTRAPWIMPIQLSKDELYRPYNPDFWPKYQGIEEGEQWPWSTTKQRIVWNARDDYKTLVNAWERSFECMGT